MAALATVALAYQIIHRLYRGYMLNSRVFRVAVFLDMLILHFLLLLLISRIYANP